MRVMGELFIMEAVAYTAVPLFLFGVVIAGRSRMA